jgi:hypothetical protein
MKLLESLPSRPLSAGELTALNRADALDLAVALEGEEPARGITLATDRWAKALGFDGEGWQVVATVSLGDRERVEALQDCEDALLAFFED